ncbi:hypothetical protein ABIC83_002929 [Roseateles asaccharophilus]|uniref:hypothetical protein n=1 Tax=Roseateles asaccharophilus TaxID=582607 RepID=UPI003833D5A5
MPHLFNPVTPTKLPKDDPKALLAALQDTVDPKALEVVSRFRPAGASHYQSVHSHILDGFMNDVNEETEACCRRLLELKAPITSYFDLGAEASFFGYSWPTEATALQRVTSLCDHYVAAGAVDLNWRKSGAVKARAEWTDLSWEHFSGLNSLAAAIVMDNEALVRYLVERSVSTNIGLVYSDQPPFEAVDLAADLGRGEICAYLATRSMEEHLASALRLRESVPTPANSAPSDHRIRRAGL